MYVHTYKLEIMKHLKIYSTILLALGLALFSACSDDTVDPEPETEVEKYTYTNHAGPILDAMCATSGCHVSGAQTGSLEGYTDAKAFVGWGRIKGAINHETDFKAMPPTGTKMSDEMIETIETWINDGLLE